MEITTEIHDRLSKLQEKYAAMGQDITAYLDGLLYADYLTYWDYIHLDTLLSLQHPKTSYPDEKIFIVYHQITELYFNLTLHECAQISSHSALTASFFASRLKRINAYFTALVSSFDIMVDGMDKEQFLKFRMSLLPASGFQSGQYRMIEIYSTELINLVTPSKREELKDASLTEQFEYLYWKYGASELSTGKQTLTLQQFIGKYTGQLIHLAQTNVHSNFSQLYKKLQQSNENEEELKQVEEELRKLDLFVNVEWPLSHYKSAVRYLERDPVDIAATGGTNWQKYLPPRFQKRIFFPFLWTTEQMEQWGKSWVMNVLKSYRV